SFRVAGVRRHTVRGGVCVCAGAGVFPIVHGGVFAGTVRTTREHTVSARRGAYTADTTIANISATGSRRLVSCVILGEETGLGSFGLVFCKHEFVDVAPRPV